MSTRTQYQTGVYTEIPRSMIKGAPYNPRHISVYARGVLLKKIEKIGCVTPLLWNKRTGHLVSGHQRLGILDDLESDRDYIIGVMVIDVDELVEREMNVAANSSELRGDFEKDLFLSMLKEGDVDLIDAGFTRIDLEYEFGDIDGLADFFKRETAAVSDAIKEIERVAEASPERASSVKDIRKKGLADAIASPKSDSEYYVVIAFERAEMAPWLKKNGFAADGVLTFDQVKHLLAEKKRPAEKRKRSSAGRSVTGESTA